ncbi:NAD(P)-dependent oxidoreductase [Campylobacter curvus]|uniref:NAD(P)-dependent oxidoreductase n=1 Tax=Campylobacter curvus TaxID=200 RepID=UPI00038226BC|nr:NAD(P)-dependent oxidoreductase [Campylobacter curvus]QKF61717.1 NAD(P)-dependent oxidoreductase [Campylobacter curvus]UEB50014.1 NAD(P)-dependent oxidoreductase [Campylobacter curvus]
MKVAIIGANGKAGGFILNEALSRGYDVTAIVRNKAYKNDKVKILYKDIMSLKKADLAGFDAVISAFGSFNGEEHTRVLTHLADMLSGSDTRLLVVGGAGSLYTDASHTMRLFETPDFPSKYKPTATAMAKAFDALRKRSDVKWTYFSPAAEFDPSLPKSGKYTLGGEEFILNRKGESVIGYADYAVAMIDELENAKFVQKRFTAVGERA